MEFEIEKITARDTYNLLIGLVAPRPIALVTSLSAGGQLNAAPFSAYNYLSTHPPIVGFGVASHPGPPPRPKDTLRNIRATGEFVVNVVTEDLAEEMNICAIDFPPEQSELDAAGLETTPSSAVKVPRIARAHAALECRLYSVLEVSDYSRIVLGQVISVYAEDRFIDPEGPYVRADELHAIGRMNGLGNYVRTRDAFFTLDRIRLEDWQAARQK